MLNKISELKREEVKQCIEAVKSCGRIKRMIVFGSAATKSYRPDSDLDICLDIEGSDRGSDLFNVAKRFGEICHNNYDVVTYSKTSGKLRDEIDKKGIIVCQPPHG